MNPLQVSSSEDLALLNPFSSSEDQNPFSSMEKKRESEEEEEEETTTMTKIVARPSPEDDESFFPLPSPHHRRNNSTDRIVAKIPENYSNRSKSIDNIDVTKSQVDTAPPFESVKAAVSKFGGIVDWKAHRVQTVERRKFIEQELEKAQQELPSYKKRCLDAEEEKSRMLERLDSTKRLIEELKLNVDRAKTEEQQAKQDSELANLRVDEMEQGIADEASFAAKAQLEVARARHLSAVSELENVRAELRDLKRDYSSMVPEKDSAVKKAEEAVLSLKQVEKSVEDLTIELISLKQALESAQSAHLEAEEHRIAAVMAKEQENLNWEKELKEAEEELLKLTHQMEFKRELKSKLDQETEKLHDLKKELAAYMESESEECTFQDVFEEPRNRKHADFDTAISAAKEELDEARGKIERSKNEVQILKATEAALRSELEKNNTELEEFRHNEGMALIAIASVEDELNKTDAEITAVELKEKDEREKIGDLPKMIHEAEVESDKAKSQCEMARQMLEQAKEESKQAKASANSVESKLLGAEKEIEAAKASEKLALAAISALAESEKIDSKDSPEDDEVTLTLEDYYDLSKRAHEAQEEANLKIAEAMSEIKKSKESEMISLRKLQALSHEMYAKKDELDVALQEAEQAQEGKLAVEQELRKWRAEHEQRRKATESLLLPVNTSRSPEEKSSNFVTVTDTTTLHQRTSPKGYTSNTETGSATDNKVAAKKKKKSFFPRFFMFLGRRKSSSKSS